MEVDGSRRNDSSQQGTMTIKEAGSSERDPRMQTTLPQAGRHPLAIHTRAFLGRDDAFFVRLDACLGT